MNALQHPLLTLEVCRIRIDFKARQKWEVYGKEPIFRGQMGRYLRQGCCPFYDDPGKDCENCGLAKGCLYLKLFAPQTRNPSDPRPFVPVLEGENSQSMFQKGEKGKAGLVLMGPAITYSSLFCEAALSALGAFPLQTGPVQVEMPEGPVFSHEAEHAGRTLKEWAERDFVQGRECRGLRFVTPMRVTGKERGLRDDVNFFVLMQALLRRLRDLKRAFDTDRDMGDSREILDKAAQVQVRENRLKWEKRERYSARQGQDVYLSGFTGYISFDREISDFYPLLKAAEIVHVGKGTSGGCGRVELVGR